MLIIAIIIGAAIDIFTLYCCCVAASKADDIADAWREDSIWD